MKLQCLEGHLITGYADGDDPNKPLVAGASADAAQFLKSHPDTLARFDRVSQLVDGFETPYGMELLATVHFVAKEYSATSVEGAVHHVHA